MNKIKHLRQEYFNFYLMNLNLTTKTSKITSIVGILAQGRTAILQDQILDFFTMVAIHHLIFTMVAIHHLIFAVIVIHHKTFTMVTIHHLIFTMAAIHHLIFAMTAIHRTTFTMVIIHHKIFIMVAIHHLIFRFSLKKRPTILNQPNLSVGTDKQRRTYKLLKIAKRPTRSFSGTVLWQNRYVIFTCRK